MIVAYSPTCFKLMNYVRERCVNQGRIQTKTNGGVTGLLAFLGYSGGGGITDTPPPPPLDTALLTHVYERAVDSMNI